MKTICVLVFIFLQISGLELLPNKLQRWDEYEYERPTLIELALMPSSVIGDSYPRSRKRCEVNHHGCEETELIQKVRTLEGLEKVGKRSIRPNEDKFLLDTPLIQSYYEY